MRALRQKLSRLAPFPLRLMAGVGFVYHGYLKLFSIQGHLDVVSVLQELKIPAPEIMGWVVGLMEVCGGVALLLGCLTGIVSVLLIAGLAVMMARMPGLEVNLVYLSALVSLLLSGPGSLSISGRGRLSKKVTGMQTVFRAEPDRVPIEISRQRLRRPPPIAY